jgi:hypothetical protein
MVLALEVPGPVRDNQGCLMNDWNIQSRAHACQACARPFADKQPYHTLLFDEKQDFRRMDVCQPCWQAQFGQGATDRKGFVSYWQGTYEAPPAAAPEAIQKENAESLLRKIIELQDPKYAAAGFILAVMLERKRILKVKEQLTREGGRVFVYEHSKTGDVFTITDPNLQLDQLEGVQREVGDLLQHGFAAPPEVSAADSQPPAACAEPAPTPAPAEA